MFHRSLWCFFALLVAMSLVTCQRPDDAKQLSGFWRGVLESPGGELPFFLRLEGSGPSLKAEVVNGKDTAPISSVEVRGDEVVLHFDHYDSEITCRWMGPGLLEGSWRRTGARSDTVMPFRAERMPEGKTSPRFGSAKIQGANVASVGGNWSVEFKDGNAIEVARGEFRQQGSRVEGSFLTPTGDYRYLEGQFEQGLLRLSTFDGSHAFLFQALAQADGSLVGDFWSRDAYHATWTARPTTDLLSAELPDPWAQVQVTSADGRLRFAFADIEGRVLDSSDSRFAGKVVIVNLFGSWCPNCNDEAPLLASWSKRYRNQGLEIVGLAYEYTGKVDRDRLQVRRFAERHGIDYPLLLAGTSDKKAAAATLPDLSRVTAFPTTVFIGRDGKVRKIHAGFSGPGTGEHFQELVRELEAVIEGLLAE